MTELTNEAVATALGWFPCSDHAPCWTMYGDDALSDRCELLPDFLHDPGACFGPGGPWMALFEDGWRWAIIGDKATGLSAYVSGSGASFYSLRDDYPTITEAVCAAFLAVVRTGERTW